MTALTFRDDGMLKRFENQLSVLGANADVALARALNHTGMKARTQVIRHLTKQTGLKRSVIVRAVKTNRARHGNEQFKVRNTARLTFTLSSEGGDISLKFFDPKEVKGGVSAKPRGKRQLYADTFTHGGRFPKRIGPVMGGHVFANISAGHAWRGKVELQNSGVYIPDESVNEPSFAIG